MGYYVFIEESNVCIPADRCEQALYDLNVLNQINKIKRGFKRWSYEEGKMVEGEESEYGEHPAVHFSWMPHSFEEFTHVNDVLTAVGFETLMVDGIVEINGYDNKHGCEDMILAAIAKHLVSYDDDPPSITWRGEEADDVYRDTFVNGGMYRSQAEIVRHFDHSFPITDDDFQAQMLKAEKFYEEMKGGE